MRSYKNLIKMASIAVLIGSANLALANSDAYLKIKNTNKDKTHKVDLKDADEWPFLKLHDHSSGGEDSENKYSVCYEGKSKDVIKILEKMVKAENKDSHHGSDRSELVIVNTKTTKKDSIIIETGWNSTPQNTVFSDVIEKCK